ncbi:nuclear protein [Panaeolus papilionaceus]|nr:nuclear protein [Panaeolus papilionaceus]
MSKGLKILTVGSAEGAIREIFNKIKAIDAKHGKFDLVLCVGDFFGHLNEDSASEELTELLDGRIEVPLQCYIMQGGNPLPTKVIERFAKSQGELCHNVFLMSKSGTVTTADGVRIACLGGIYDPQIYGSAEAAPGFLSPFFSHHTIDRLLSNTLTNSSSTSRSYTSLASIQASSSATQLVDILLTNVWPDSVPHLSSIPLPVDPTLPKSLAPPLDDLIRKTKPRYHFAASAGQPPKFWEREPYVWDNEDQRISRFVSLGAFKGESTGGKKPRWFYAFSLAPMTSKSEPLQRPSNATKNPFVDFTYRPPKRHVEDTGENFFFGGVNQPTKRVRKEGEPGKPPPGYKCKICDAEDHFIKDCPDRVKPPDNYICKICQEPGHFVRDCPTKDARGDTGGRKPRPGYVCRACGSELHYLEDCEIAKQRPPPHGDRRGKRAPLKEIAPDECWFCLSNPNLAKHLIVAIGSECYVTLPKGQIIPTQSAADHVDVPGGGHVLIVPITHYPTFNTIPSDLAQPIINETQKYKDAVKEMYAKYGCCTVSFEVGRLSAKGGHAHVQLVPVPQRLRNRVEEAFLAEGRATGVDFEADADAALVSCANGKGNYFKVEIPDGKKLVHLIRDHGPFNIQFGRQVLVHLMNMPERLDWKACMLSEDEDRADAEAFKSAFTPFNFAA